MPLDADLPVKLATTAHGGTPPAMPDEISGAQALVDLATGDKPVRVVLEWLPSELIAGIAAYLPFEDRHRFSQASAGLHRVLLADLQAERIVLCAARVTTLSTLARALAEIAALPRRRHEAALCGLAQGLHRLHESMAARAIQALLDAVAALPPERRRLPLTGLIRSLGDVPQSTRQPWLEARAIELALDAAPPQRGPLLAKCLRHLGIATLRGRSLGRWLRLAEPLCEADRAAVLAQLAHVTGFGKSMGQWDAARDRLLDAVLRPPQGSGMAPRHRAEVLRALAEELECHLEDENEGDASAPGAGPSAVERVWTGLFDAAAALPAPDAIPVFGALARCLEGASAPFVDRAWQRLRHCAGRFSTQDRIALLAVLTQCLTADASAAQIWDALMAIPMQLPDALAGMVLSQLARLLMEQGADAGLPARWAALLARIASLPPACRLAPLRAAATTMAWLPGGVGATLWPALQAQLSRLGPSERAPLLAECARADTLPPGVWDGIFAQACQAPAPLRPALLAALASSGELVRRAPTPRHRWLALFRQTRQLDAGQRFEPLLALTLALERLPQAAARAPAALLAAAIAALPASDAARLLGTRALSITDVRTWRWCLDRALTLPPVLQSLLLSRLASAAARLGLARMAVQALWDLLWPAIAALPRTYRARPLLEMPALVALLPRTAHRDAQAQIAAELARTPEADWPAWFDAQGERAPKRSKHE